MVSARGATNSGVSPQLGFCSFPALIDNLDVVVEDGCDDGHHVGFNNPRADVFGPSHADVEDALEGEVPLPHVHHVLASALLEDAYQSLNAAIDREDVPYPGRGGCEVGEVVERVDEREGRGAVEGAAVVQSGSDADRSLVGVRDAKIDLAHVCLLVLWVLWGGVEGASAALVSHVVKCRQCGGRGGRDGYGGWPQRRAEPVLSFPGCP